ncbi:MAG: hypothetical protein Q7U41_01835 [Microbacterium sp.]|nr:hypothetical protein [Microbacterium sp.]
MLVAVVAVLLAGCGAPGPSAVTTPVTSTPTTTATGQPTGETSTAPTGEPTTAPTDETTTEPTEEPTDEPTDEPKAASPRVIAAQVEGERVHVSAIINGVSENGGTCTATASANGSSASATQTAVYNVNRTECGGLYLKVKRLGSGSWTIVVAYESDTAGGVSAPFVLEVP